MDLLRREGLAAERVPFEGHGTCYFELGSGRVAKVDADYLGARRLRREARFGRSAPPGGAARSRGIRNFSGTIA